ncbi:cycloheximide resistance protein [Xylariaceae sp. FL0255]|nr:cycloheximide resistance protein [Xylariaceae sp. FL0255]
MDSNSSTDTTAHSTEMDVEKRQDLQRRISQTTEEGHDANIPSSAGYALDEAGEFKRRQSIQDQKRRASSAGGEKSDGIDLENGADKAVTNTEDEDPNVVFWDGPDDPENPYNWPVWKKAVNCGLISAMTLFSPLASSIFAPAIPEVEAEFHNSSLEIASFVVSVYLLGFAFGPLIIAPLSEMYGRVIIYHVCNVGFVAFTVACALAPTLNALIGFRFVAGLFGVSPLTIGGGSIADMVTQENRGAVLSLYSVGPLLGPIIGPIAGGFLSSAKGWRWNFWLIAIFMGFITIVMLIFAKESYAPIILQRKADRLRKETGNPLFRSKLDVGLSTADFFKRGAVRPLKMLVLSPIVWIMALYTAITYGYLYLEFTSITEVFQETYGFSTSVVGLAFLGLGVGSFLGVTIYSVTSDRYIRRKAAEADRKAEAMGTEKKGMKPEYRLQLLPYGAALVPAGLFIYGWTAQYKIHWIVPIIGTGIGGIGNLLVFLCIQTYLVDAFTVYAASAVATNTVIRSIAGAVLPLAGLQLYATLGLGWGNSLLAFIAVALLPVSVVMLKCGERLRTKYAIKDL